MLTADGNRNAFERPAGCAGGLGGGEPVAGVVVGVRGERSPCGERAVFDDEVARGRVEVVVGPEPEVGVLTFRRRVHPTALVSTEGFLRVVVDDDVLAELRSDALEQIAEVTEDGEVPQERVFPLGQVVDDHRRNDDRDDDEEPRPPVHLTIISPGLTPTRPGVRYG